MNRMERTLALGVRARPETAEGDFKKRLRCGCVCSLKDRTETSNKIAADTADALGHRLRGSSDVGLSLPLAREFVERDLAVSVRGA